VTARLRAAGIRAGTVAVKIRDSGFPDGHATEGAARAERPDGHDLAGGARADPAEIRGKKIRLLGVAATQLGQPEQIGMFEVVDERQRRVVDATDAVRRRFGDRARHPCESASAGIARPVRNAIPPQPSRAAWGCRSSRTTWSRRGSGRAAGLRARWAVEFPISNQRRHWASGRPSDRPAHAPQPFTSRPPITPTRFRRCPKVRSRPASGHGGGRAAPRSSQCRPGVCGKN